MNLILPRVSYWLGCQTAIGLDMTSKNRGILQVLLIAVVLCEFEPLLFFCLPSADDACEKFGGIFAIREFLIILRPHVIHVLC